MAMSAVMRSGSKYSSHGFRHPELTREFPHSKAQQAEAYRDHVLHENPDLKARSVVIVIFSGFDWSENHPAGQGGE
jgi:hypothetical protein